jgi:hypothetical protein
MTPKNREVGNYRRKFKGHTSGRNDAAAAKKMGIRAPKLWTREKRTWNMRSACVVCGWTVGVE